MTTRSAWGLGLATVTDDGNTLDVWYPRPVLGDEPDDGHADLLASLSAMERRDEARGVHTTLGRREKIPSRLTVLGLTRRWDRVCRRR